MGLGRDDGASPVNSPDNAHNCRISAPGPYMAKPHWHQPPTQAMQFPMPRFTPEFIDDLKARLPVSEVVGKRVKLKRAGRECKGLSPFQQEKTPSFTVNDQKQFYHDFSTGKHGNIFDFVMETEGVSFPEAVERLASMAGMPLPVGDAGCRAP